MRLELGIAWFMLGCEPRAFLQLVQAGFFQSDCVFLTTALLGSLLALDLYYFQQQTDEFVLASP